MHNDYNTTIYELWKDLEDNIQYFPDLDITNKNKFERVSLGPILDRSDKVPYLANSPFIHENKMFFCNTECMHTWQSIKCKGNKSPKYTSVDVCCDICKNSFITL